MSTIAQALLFFALGIVINFVCTFRLTRTGHKTTLSHVVITLVLAIFGLSFMGYGLYLAATAAVGRLS